mmetsp:Transcript_2532/g.2759  ORF Transcript_2532/g.2759 Transcript_2532/m.2759 type:complete len:187 (-) Transcript_2532:185-745(-)
MARTYSRDPAVPAKSVRARGDSIRVHYKNTYETVRAVKGMNLKAAIKYIKDVIEHKRCIPYHRYTGHVGRTGQAKEFGTTLGRWPTKSAKVVLGLLQNLEANANVKSLDADKLIITHAQVDQAQEGRRRTYRAHGRITPFCSAPCHIQLFATLKEEDVKKEANKNVVARLSKKQLARQRVHVGEKK